MKRKVNVCQKSPAHVNMASKVKDIKKMWGKVQFAKLILDFCKTVSVQKNFAVIHVDAWCWPQDAKVKHDHSSESFISVLTSHFICFVEYQDNLWDWKHLSFMPCSCYFLLCDVVCNNCSAVLSFWLVLCTIWRQWVFVSTHKTVLMHLWGFTWWV